MSEWYYGKKKIGPLSKNEIQQRIESGEFDGYTKVAKDSEKMQPLYMNRVCGLLIAANGKAQKSMLY